MPLATWPGPGHFSVTQRLASRLEPMPVVDGLHTKGLGLRAKAMGSEPISKIKQLQKQAQEFFEEKDIETQDERVMSKGRRAAYFCVLLIKSFFKNRCPVRATALAYTTLLALIPLLAVVVGISTTFLKSQGEKPIQQMIDTVVASVAPQLDLVAKTNVVTRVNGEGAVAPKDDLAGRHEVARKITEYIANIHSGTLGITGFISLVLVTILLLSNIEKTFNDIWDVAKGRSWTSRVVLYWTTITLGPIFIFAAIGLTSSAHLQVVQKLLSYMPILGNLVFRFLPFCILILFFTLFYKLMPNTKVHWNAALVGGAVGGLLWQLNNLFNVIYVSKVVSYSKIYGSFGMLPVFLVGLYFSWLILLFGAQVAYAVQNQSSYIQGRLLDSINMSGREFVAVRMMVIAGKRFHLGEKAISTRESSDLLAVPSRLTQQLAAILVKARLLVEVAGQETTYSPARPLDKISIQDILIALRSSQGIEPPTANDPSRDVIRQEINQIRQAEKQVASTVTLQSLILKLS